MSEPKTVGSEPLLILFDGSHGEEVTTQGEELSKLAALLEMNGFRSRTTQGPLTKDELEGTRVLVLGNPFNSTFNPGEVETIHSYVREGGGLLLISGATIFGRGGDAARRTNLNAIAQPLGLSFSDKAVTPSSVVEEASVEAEAFIATPAADHPVTKSVLRLLFVSCCAVTATSTSEEKAWELFRASNAAGAPVVVAATTHGSGRVLAMGGSTPFFNSHLGELDHEVFLVQSFRWLAGIPTNQPIRRLHIPAEEPSRLPAGNVVEEIQRRLDRMQQELLELKEMVRAALQEIRRLLLAFQSEGDQVDV